MLNSSSAKLTKKVRYHSHLWPIRANGTAPIWTPANSWYSSMGGFKLSSNMRDYYIFMEETVRCDFLLILDTCTLQETQTETLRVKGTIPKYLGKLGPALVSSLLCSQLLITPNQIDPDKTIINSCRKLVFQPPSRTRVYVYVQIAISSLVTRAHGASHKILNTCPILDA